ncbi:MAG TPA: GNAT family N-acetyltransferase [Vicinamibacteria bacterium]|nr:GNAT family N-acetyltransferase [Vicinamibacteria bacterium]
MIADGPRELAEGPFRLREVRPEDSPSLYRWRMQEDARPMFLNTDEVPFATHQSYYERYFQPANTDRWFVIEHEGVPVGSIALYGLSPDGSEYEWGRLVVAREHRGHGAAMAAFRLLLRYGRLIGVRRIRSEVLEANERVTAMHDQLGFRRAERREHDGRRFVLFVVDL